LCNYRIIVDIKRAAYGVKDNRCRIRGMLQIWYAARQSGQALLLEKQ